MRISEAINQLEEIKLEFGDLELYTFNIFNRQEKVHEISLCQKTLNDGGEVYGVSMNESPENMKKRIWEEGSCCGK